MENTWKEIEARGGVGAVDPASIDGWSEKAPAVFEPLEKVRIFGGSNSPILLEAV